MPMLSIFPGVGLEFRVEALEEGPVLVRQRRRVEDVLEAARRTPRPRWRRDLKMECKIRIMLCIHNQRWGWNG